MLLVYVSLGLTLFPLQAANSTAPRTEVGVSEKQPPASADGISQLRTLAEGGNAEAQLKLASAYENGDGVSQNDQLAAKWYRKAAEQGNAEAQSALGLMYLTGKGVEQNKREAVLWYHKAARQGDANAMYNLGAAYYNGDGVDINDSLSYAWFMLAKEAGDSHALEAVQRAETELQAQTVTAGYENIAEMYERGEYLPQNPAEAMKWWQKAATRGNRDAQMAAADRLLNGRGISQDLLQGMYWCKEAAKAGDERGQYCMGLIHQRGLGVTRDAKEARKWYERAASRNAPATKALAAMQATGEGGKVDRPAACLLYVKLAASGDEDALRSLAKLRKDMSAKEWKKVVQELHLMRIDPAKLEAALQKINAP
jgi:TPR repeat protein